MQAVTKKHSNQKKSVEPLTYQRLVTLFLSLIPTALFKNIYASFPQNGSSVVCQTACESILQATRGENGSIGVSYLFIYLNL